MQPMLLFTFLTIWAVDSMLALNYLASVSIAYFFSEKFQFLANRHFTFGSVKEHHGKQMICYLALLILNYLITNAVVRECVERLLLPPYSGIWFSLLFTPFAGYFLARLWVADSRTEK